MKKSYVKERQQMVDEQLRARDITDERVLAAMGEVRRDLFVPDDLKNFAYLDRPLPIGEDQTISQPYIVALMAQALALDGSEYLLEVGGGCGYSAAVHGACPATIHRRLQRPDHCGAHGDHPPSLQAGAIDLFRHRGAQFTPLSVDLVVLDLLLFDRTKGIQSNVECHKGHLHAHVARWWRVESQDIFSGAGCP